MLAWTSGVIMLCQLAIYFFFFFLMIRRPPRSTLFPTRRSSDLARVMMSGLAVPCSLWPVALFYPAQENRRKAKDRDRKSTRLNSSHGYISYAVFCLKKKKKKIITS